VKGNAHGLGKWRLQMGENVDVPEVALGACAGEGARMDLMTMATTGTTWATTSMAWATVGHPV